MKVIFPVMKTSWAVVKIRPKKGLYRIWTHDLYDTGAGLYWYCRAHRFKSHTSLNFFFWPSFHYCSNTVHYCEDCFHIRMSGNMQNHKSRNLKTLWLPKLKLSTQKQKIRIWKAYLKNFRTLKFGDQISNK